MPEVEQVLVKPQRLTYVPEQRVYVKATWQEEWEDVSADVWCSQVTWSLSPALPHAQLEIRYGRKYQEGALGWRIVNRSDLQGKFVMVVIGTSATENAIQSQRKWIGYCELTSDAILGVRTVFTGTEDEVRQSGRQFVVAYGLERMLEKKTLTTSWVHHPGDGEEYSVNRALGFNEGGYPNMDAVGALFTRSEDGGFYWTTAEIVKYLLAKQSPTRGESDNPLMNWVLGDDIDHCVETGEVLAEGKNLRQMLNALLPRFRLRAWYCEPSDERGGDIKIRVVSLTDEDLELGEVKGKEGQASIENLVIPANPRQLQLDLTQDKSAEVDLKQTEIDTVDRVVVRGAPITSTGTFTHGLNKYILWADWAWTRTLLPGWTTEQETQFTIAASAKAAYAALSVGNKEAANKLARQSRFLRPVFSRFVIDPDFAGYLKEQSQSPLFPLFAEVGDDEIVENLPDPQAPSDLQFAETTALREEIDYKLPTTDVLGKSPTTKRYMGPLVFFPTVETFASTEDSQLRYQLLDNQGLIANLPDAGMNQQSYWSAMVTVDDQGALRVVVQGETQDVIAGRDWQRLENDQQPLADWRQMLVTASVEWSAYAEAIARRDPPAEDADRRQLREVVLYAGKRYRLDWLVPGTVVGVDPLGALETNAAGGWIANDVAELQQIAKVALGWYGRTRNVLHLTSKVITDQINLGDYIVSLANGSEEPLPVHSVVTEISCRFNQVESSKKAPRAPVPTIEITTGFGELDPLRMGVTK